MVSVWKRIPADDAALTASADTTETQIGTGIDPPTWAKSIKALRIAHRLITLTTDQEIAGYLRLNDEAGNIDPFYMPLPIAQALTGGLGQHSGYAPILLPVELPAKNGNIVRAYSAYDAATTGVHTMATYVLFSSQDPRFIMHAQQTGVQTQSTSSVTAAATAETINTIADKTGTLLGFWGYIIAGGGITAAESCQGYVKITSSLSGWITQELPLNIQPSGISTQITPDTSPVIAIHKDILNGEPFSGFIATPFPEKFNMPKARNAFTFTGYMDGANAAAPTGRFGLIYQE